MSGRTWKGKTAVVCGGSSGLGRALAEQLVREGIARMAILGRDRERLERAQRELQQLDRTAIIEAAPVDLLDREGLRQWIGNFVAASQSASGAGFVGEVAPDGLSAPGHSDKASSGNTFSSERATSVDLVIQAVGKSDRGTVLSLDAARLDALMAVNVQTSLNAVQLFSPHVAPGGAIVLIGSLASLLATRYLGGYAIAKHALAALAQQARRELVDQGVHVLLACPGPIQRPDAGSRYRELPHAGQVPPEALRPGGGARLRGLEPNRLAKDILRAAAKRRALLIRPRKAALLWSLSTVWPEVAEAILKRSTA
ncbi:MAG: oxidoreductase [Pirellulaceae bacterium]|nr:MAG: oxidoreductase [Pirellulaceae bacterium]